MQPAARLALDPLAAPRPPRRAARLRLVAVDVRGAREAASGTLAARGARLTETAKDEGEVADGEAASPDAEIVAAVAVGDRSALAALYDRYVGLLMGLGVRILRNRRESEDLVHDVFLEVWRRAPTYDPARASVRAWLVLMMRCRALDRRKSHAFKLRASLDHDPRVAPETEGPSEVLERNRLAEQVQALPENQREVLILGYFEGLSSTEIAERLDIPLGTVKSRVAAGIRALRKAMVDDPEEDREEDGDQDGGAQ